MFFTFNHAVLKSMFTFCDQIWLKFCSMHFQKICYVRVSRSNYIFSKQKSIHFIVGWCITIEISMEVNSIYWILFGFFRIKKIIQIETLKTQNCEMNLLGNFETLPHSLRTMALATKWFIYRQIWIVNFIQIHHNNAINVTYSRQCSIVFLFGMIKHRLSWEWIKSCLYM